MALACSFYDPSLLTGDGLPGVAGASGGSSGGASGGSLGTGGVPGTGGSDAAAGGGGAGGLFEPADDAATEGEVGMAGRGGAGGTDADIDTSTDISAPDAAPDARDAAVEVLDATPDTEDATTPDVVADAASEVRDAAQDTQDAAAEGPACTGYALSCGGTNFFTIPRPVQDDFTLEAWIKTTSSDTGSYFWEGRGVFYADSTSGQANDFATSILNNKYAFGVGVPDITLVSTSNVTTGQWVHVAATRQKSSGTIQIFVNGALENQAVASNTNSLTTTPAIAIGSNTQGLGNFIGLMDELRIWSLVRTPAQIAATMRQRLIGNEAGLVGYWRFDAQDAGAPVDSSPTNASATMVGAPVWVAPDAICSP
jgi:hypothetical protein